MYELRWFLEDKGNNWQQVKNWFYHLPTPPELDADREPKLNFDNIKKVRMEVYFQCREDIGLKLSRGGLQIKIRSRKAELFHSDAAAEGFLEYWEKKTWKYLDNEGNDRKKKSVTRFGRVLKPKDKKGNDSEPKRCAG